MTYSHIFPRTPRPVAILYKGIEIARHATAEDANAAADRLAKACNTAIENFTIRPVAP